MNLKVLEVFRPASMVIKVFETTMSKSRNQDEYIRKFFNLEESRRINQNKKLKSQRLAELWAQKEAHILEKIHGLGIPAPLPIFFKKHMLVMNQIGEDKPAPKLSTIKKSAFETEEKVRIFNASIQILKNLFSRGKLVHTDFGPDNLLICDGEVHVIDVCQAVEMRDARAMVALFNDCQRILMFFKETWEMDILNVELDERKLFEEITGVGLETGLTEEEVMRRLERVCFDEEKEKFVISDDVRGWVDMI